MYIFFQAEDGIRGADVTGVQTCALPIFHQPDDPGLPPLARGPREPRAGEGGGKRSTPARAGTTITCIIVSSRTRVRSEERRVGKECRSRRAMTVYNK